MIISNTTNLISRERGRVDALCLHNHSPIGVRNSQVVEDVPLRHVQVAHQRCTTLESVCASQSFVTEGCVCACVCVCVGGGGGGYERVLLQGGW
jgi:hypothetical protein